MRAKPLECGSLLPLSPASLLALRRTDAAQHQAPNASPTHKTLCFGVSKDSAPAGWLRKAAAGCRSPQPIGLRALVAVILTLSASAAIKLDPGPIPELRPPREELPPAAERKQRDLLPWFIGTGIIAVIAAALAARPRKLPPLPTPPYTIARRRLEELTGITATPVAISAILRDYLLDAFRIPARGATPGELIGWLSAHPRWDTQMSSEASALLEACDVAKFSPTPPENHPVEVEQTRTLIARIEGKRTSGQS